VLTIVDGKHSSTQFNFYVGLLQIAYCSHSSNVRSKLNFIHEYLMTRVHSSLTCSLNAGIQLDQLVQLVQFVVLKKRIGLPRPKSTLLTLSDRPTEKVV